VHEVGEVQAGGEVDEVEEVQEEELDFKPPEEAKSSSATETVQAQPEQKIDEAMTSQQDGNPSEAHHSDKLELPSSPTNEPEPEQLIEQDPQQHEQYEDEEVHTAEGRKAVPMPEQVCPPQYV
jgi:hypothetical protein